MKNKTFRFKVISGDLRVEMQEEGSPKIYLCAAPSVIDVLARPQWYWDHAVAGLIPFITP